jgi:hypothetical protein
MAPLPRCTRGSTLILMLAVAASCGAAAATPAGTVRLALERMAAHDLPAANLLLCRERQGFDPWPVRISGIFEPIGAMPDSDPVRNLSLIHLDLGRVMITELTVGAEMASVRVHGTIGQQFDPGAVEAMFRAMAAEQGQPVDDVLLAQTLANVAQAVDLPVDEEVALVREGGAWRVCPPAPRAVTEPQVVGSGRDDSVRWR